MSTGAGDRKWKFPPASIDRQSSAFAAEANNDLYQQHAKQIHSPGITAMAAAAAAAKTKDYSAGKDASCDAPPMGIAAMAAAAVKRKTTASGSMTGNSVGEEHPSPSAPKKEDTVESELSVAQESPFDTTADICVGNDAEVNRISSGVPAIASDNWSSPACITNDARSEATFKLNTNRTAMAAAVAAAKNRDDLDRESNEIENNAVGTPSINNFKDSETLAHHGYNSNTDLPATDQGGIGGNESTSAITFGTGLSGTMANVSRDSEDNDINTPNGRASNEFAHAIRRKVIPSESLDDHKEDDIQSREKADNNVHVILSTYVNGKEQLASGHESKSDKLDLNAALTAKTLAFGSVDHGMDTSMDQTGPLLYVRPKCSENRNLAWIAAVAKAVDEAEFDLSQSESFDSSSSGDVYWVGPKNSPKSKENLQREWLAALTRAIEKHKKSP
jgi:hypothetical protein